MVIATIAIVGTLLLVSTIINDSSSNMSVNAQAQQQSSKEAPEKGTIFVFNEKSRPANEPEKCADLASVIKGKSSISDVSFFSWAKVIPEFIDSTPIVRAAR